MHRTHDRGAVRLIVLVLVAVVGLLAFAAAAVLTVGLRARTDERARRALRLLPVVGPRLAGPEKKADAPKAEPAAQAQEAAKAAPEKPPSAQAASGAAAPQAAPAALAALAPGADASELIARLQAEREFQIAKARELADRQERLTVLRDEIEHQKTLLLALRRSLDESWEKLNQQRAEFQSKVTEIKVEESRNLKQLAATCERMSPEHAAATLDSLTIEIVTKILANAEPARRAKILEKLDPKKAGEISERLIFVIREKAKPSAGI